MATKSVYDIIRDCIIKRLESGIVPWHKPWKTFGPPRNLVSDKPYRGINHFLLGCANYPSLYFLTYKQAKQLSGHVRKGERSLPCVFWTEWETEDNDTGEAVKIPVLRYYSVFNSDQCEGLDHKRLDALREPEEFNPFNPIADADTVVESMPRKPAIEHNEPRAYYRPSTETVKMPSQGLFDSPETYYSTLFHELTHAADAGDPLRSLLATPQCRGLRKHRDAS